MSFSYMQPSSAPQQKSNPYQQQYGQPQQASPFSAPDMSVYSGPRTPPKGAKTNDLSGQVPANQIWAQAYNQGSKQYGGNTQAQSWTMPGSYTSQGYNPSTGQYGQPTGGKSWDGNMAYNAIDKRAAPIQANATGVGGNQMPWQDAMAQREAFVGNLSQRLNQYNAGQLTGPVTFDQNQLLSQADNQLAKGTFANPFSQNPDVQRAMGNASQYMQGDFQNPFGQQANVQAPSWNQQSYSPDGSAGFGDDVVTVPQQSAQPQSDPMSRSPATWSDADLQAANQAAEARARQQASRGLMDGGVRYYRDPATGKVLSDSMSGRGQDATADWNAGEAWRAKNPTPTVYASRQPTTSPAPASTPSSARPIEPPSQGTPYNPQGGAQSLPPVPAKRINTKQIPPARYTQKAPPIRAPRNMVIVPPNMRGSRGGGMRRNGDNRR